MILLTIVSGSLIVFILFFINLKLFPLFTVSFDWFCLNNKKSLEWINNFNICSEDNYLSIHILSHTRCFKPLFEKYLQILHQSFYNFIFKSECWKQSRSCAGQENNTDPAHGQVYFFLRVCFRFVGLVRWGVKGVFDVYYDIRVKTRFFPPDF